MKLEDLKALASGVEQVRDLLEMRLALADPNTRNQTVQAYRSSLPPSERIAVHGENQVASALMVRVFKGLVRKGTLEGNIPYAVITEYMEKTEAVCDQLSCAKMTRDDCRRVLGMQR